MLVNVSVSALLDRARLPLSRGDAGGMSDLLRGLNQCRLGLGATAWREECTRAIQMHPVRELLHLEPLTRRAFQKPLGLVADAVMTDMVFTNPLPHSSRGRLEHRLYQWMMDQNLCTGIRARRSILAQAIDRTVARSPELADFIVNAPDDTNFSPRFTNFDYRINAVAKLQPATTRVLSVVGGHLRELNLSLAVIGNMVKQVVALDSHAPTLGMVEQLYKQYPVTPFECSIASLLTDSSANNLFDFIYVPTLLHFMPDQTATALVRNLFARLRPGGQLMLMNFAPTLPDIGYMECVMQWYWQYRDARALRALTAAISETQIASYAESVDVTGNLNVLSLTRSVAITQIE